MHVRVERHLEGDTALRQSGDMKPIAVNTRKLFPIYKNMRVTFAIHMRRVYCLGGKAKIAGQNIQVPPARRVLGQIKTERWSGSI